MKRIIILMLGMMFAAGIYSDVGKVHLVNMTDEFLSKISQYSSKNVLKKTIRKAEKLYKKAVKSYRGGNRGKAKEYYRKTLDLLAKVDLDVVMQPESSHEIKSLFTRLHETTDSELFNKDKLAKQYTISMDLDNDLVKRYIKVFTTNPESKERIRTALKRSGRYRAMILKVLREYNLPRELVYLPVVESLYKNNCRSRAGAVGLWQFMKHRGRALDLKINYWIDERKDPYKATRAAAQYLKDLYIMFDDWHLALAAYNRGENGLARDLDFAKATNIKQMVDRRAVPKETGNFVPQFIAAAIIGDNCEAYGFEFEYDEPHEYEEVIINQAIDLSVIARCSGATTDEIRELNPALQTWCTPLNYDDFILRLPVSTKRNFLENILAVKDLNPSRGRVRYRVRKGDCLDIIARKFHTSVKAIKADNKINKGSLIKVNQLLFVRPGRKYFSRNN